MSETNTAIAHNIEEKQRTSDVCLKELSAFSSMILCENVRKGLQKSGFVYPTNIQATAIPVGKAGLDLLIQSKAGTGKTLIFCTIICEAYRAVIPVPQSLIVVPTREIAVQIECVLNGIGQCCKGFRCVSVIGGMDATNDRKRLQGAKSIVGTPGRILHQIQNDVLNTSEIGMVILDEADRLYTSSFRSDVDRILKALPSKRQTIACSATFCNDLDKQLAKKMQNPLFISTEERATALVGIRQFAYVLAEQKSSILEMEAKLDAIRDVFGRVSFRQCLIFAGSQSRANSYRNYLERDGWPCELICGAQEQKTRLEIFQRFRDFKIRILLATDLMARGIDSEHVNLVINMEVPMEMVTYLHRIGRAGRFGSHGIAISFLSSQKEHTTFRRLCSEVGGGMTVYQLPTKTESETDLNIWDFSNEYDLYNGEGVKTATKKPDDENKENVVENPKTEECSVSSSIDTKTFQVNSKDSVFNLVDLPPASENSIGDSMPVAPCREAKLNVTIDSHLSSSQQLPSSNTIDDASSIAADSSIRSTSHLEVSSAEAKLTAQIPQLYNLLVDGNATEKDAGNNNETDLFDDYEKAVAKTGDDDSSCCTKTDDPQMTMKKLNNFRALLYDASAGLDTSTSKQIDIYSDYENFNCNDGSNDATCISQQATSSEDNSKATFVMSIDTPTNVQDSIEELQDDSSYNKEPYPSEVASVSEVKHFPSLQQPIADLHMGKQHNLTVNRAGAIDILPAPVALPENQASSSSFEDEPMNASEEDDVDLQHDDAVENEDPSSGFNENTTSASSGIDTSDVDEGVVNSSHGEDEEDSDSYRSDESIPSDDGVEDDGDESDTSSDDDDDEEEEVDSECSVSDEGTIENVENPADLDEWIHLFNNQIQIIQEYVRITKSMRI